MTNKLKEKRNAGILMHITSLPSPFGIGDLGPEAYAFADFLKEHKQQYWQLLPLNPTEGGSSHSPYSSHSSMAGNILLISLEELVKEELLNIQDLEAQKLPSTDKVDFESAELLKNKLLDKAYENFIKNKPSQLEMEYNIFLQEEQHWIRDYGLYKALKLHHNGRAWFDWSEELKNKDEKALAEFTRENSKLIDKICWRQFIFLYQWKQLKRYCNKKGILLFGDLPFYISHDSVDVWSHRDIFKVDKEGKATGIAGVPPDYFNEDGQLWGMPVFRWEVLKQQDYNWWVRRIQKNVQLYDLIRLDHFRAFSKYWEVPAGEETAKKGVWQTGPGADLFKKFNDELGDLPFIAEDLGEIDAPVYELRDKFEFPGMKVLHFAFGGDIKTSPHIPHSFTPNHIAYTGTHDNNTTVGWYRKDIGDVEKANLNSYIGHTIDETTVHKELIRLTYASVAHTAVVPMQDLLGLDENSRMNMPATTTKNWVWRMEPSTLATLDLKWLKEYVELYNRG